MASCPPEVTAMIQAAAAGRVADVEAALALGTDVNACAGPGVEYNRNVLQIGCRLNNADLVRVALAHGADVRVGGKSGDTPAHTAAAYGCDCLALLPTDVLDAVNDYGRTPLHEAADHSDVGSIALCLRHAPSTAAAVDRNGFLPIHCAASSGSSHMADAVGALAEAYAAGVTATVTDRHVLNCPPGPGATAMHFAAVSASPRAVDAINLLFRVAPHSAMVLNARDDAGRTPLACAALAHMLSDAATTQRVRALVHLGADGGMGFDDPVDYPLAAAARLGKAATVDLLLSAGWESQAPAALHSLITRYNPRLCRRANPGEAARLLLVASYGQGVSALFSTALASVAPEWAAVEADQATTWNNPIQGGGYLGVLQQLLLHGAACPAAALHTLQGTVAAWCDVSKAAVPHLLEAAHKVHNGDALADINAWYSEQLQQEQQQKEAEAKAKAAARGTHRGRKPATPGSPVARWVCRGVVYVVVAVLLYKLIVA